MTLPAGVSTRTIRLTVPTDALGRFPKLFTGTVTPDRSLVWAATGEPLWPAGAKLPAVADGVIEFAVPRVDQAGWVDSSGSPVLNWAYRLVLRATWAESSKTVTKTFQVVNSTPNPVDLELLPAGATLPVSLGHPFRADEIPFDPTPEIEADTVQAAIEEVRAEAGGGGASVAAAVAFTPAGAIGSNNVQGALEELDAEKAAQADVTGLVAALADRATDAELTAETNARVAADTAEANARLAADNALDARLDTIEADNVTQAELDAEAAARAAADTALDGRVDALEVAPPAHTHPIAGVVGLQAALDADDAALADHLGDTVDAHDASAISFAPAGTIAATNVQAAIEEVAAEAGGAGAETWTYERLAADYTNNTIGLTDVFPGFVPLPNTRYEVEVFGLVKTTDATAGFQSGLQGPGGSVAVAQKITTPSSATADLIGNVVGFGFFAAGSTPANYSVYKLHAFVEYGGAPAAGNNVRLQARSETAGQTVTMKAGSWMRRRVLP